MLRIYEYRVGSILFMHCSILFSYFANKGTLHKCIHPDFVLFIVRKLNVKSTTALEVHFTDKEVMVCLLYVQFSDMDIKIF
jgi:hypothetical protein